MDIFELMLYVYTSPFSDVLSQLCHVTLLKFRPGIRFTGKYRKYSGLNIKNFRLPIQQVLLQFYQPDCQIMKYTCPKHSTGTFNIDIEI